MMVPWAIRLAAAALLLAAAGSPGRADGTVERAAGCGDKIFVSSLAGYSVLAGISLGGIAERDELVGPVDKIGYTSLYDKTAGRNFSAIVEERGLDRAAAVQRIATACRLPLGGGFATASVVRTEGCGNKIIVSGVQGYAVLERLAGGVVGKDDTLSGDFNKPGRATVKDKQTGASLIVFVDDYRMSRAAADRKIRLLCRSGG